MTTRAPRSRRHLVGAVVLAALTVTAPRPALADEPVAQLRPLGPRVAALLSRGVERSPTIARLLSALADTDVVVYLRTSPDRRSDLAGTTGFMGLGADGRRWLMVTLYGDAGWNTLELAENRQLITLGHELRHVLEVAHDHDVNSLADFVAFYRSRGHEWREAHVDTDEARLAGRQVAMELGALR